MANRNFEIQFIKGFGNKNACARTHTYMSLGLPIHLYMVDKGLSPEKT